MGGLSLLLHVTLLWLITIFPVSRPDPPPPSYEVSLVTPQMAAGLIESASSANEESQDTQRNQTPSPAVANPASHVPPSAPEASAKHERLADLFRTAADSIAVPVPQVVARKAPSGETGPSVTPVKESVEHVLGSVRIPSEGPKAAAVTPFFRPSANRDAGGEESHVAETIKQSVATIPVPQERRPIQIAKAASENSREIATNNDVSREEVEEALRQVHRPGPVPERQVVPPLQSAQPTQAVPAPESRLQEELNQEVRGVDLPPEAPVRAPVKQVPVRSARVRGMRSGRRLSEELEQEVQRVRQPGAVPHRQPVQPVPEREEQSQAVQTEARVAEALKEEVQRVRRPGAVPHRQPVQPVPEREEQSQAAQTEARVAEALKEEVQRVRQPGAVPHRQPVQPMPQTRNRRPPVTSSRLTEELEQELKRLPVVPQIPPRETSRRPSVSERSPAPSKASPRTPRSPAFEETLKQLAKLSVPDAIPLDRPSLSRQEESGKPTQPSAKSASVGNPRRPETTLRIVGGAPKLARYLGLVQDRISRMWVPPPVDSTASSMEVVLIFRLESSGRVHQLHVERSSGNGWFDDASERAVLRAEPLPSFPETMDEPYLDVRFSFAVDETTQ